jgi:hypothetical protein
MSWDDASRRAASLGAPLLDDRDGASAAAAPAAAPPAHPRPPPRARSPVGCGERVLRSAAAARTVLPSANRAAKLVASSLAADEIAHGSGQGLKVLYAQETDQDFDRALMEVRAFFLMVRL